MLPPCTVKPTRVLKKARRKSRLPPGGRLNLTRALFYRLYCTANHDYARRVQAPPYRSAVSRAKVIFPFVCANLHTATAVFHSRQAISHFPTGKYFTRRKPYFNACPVRLAPAGQGKAYPCTKIDRKKRGVSRISLRAPCVLLPPGRVKPTRVSKSVVKALYNLY